MNSQDLTEFALHLADLAAGVTMTHFASPDLDVERKGDTTPVTIADRQAEAVMRDAITERFPDDGIVGEEHGEKEGSSGRRWILDPIDGTKSFIHQVPLFTTLIACEDEQGTVAGVIAAPALEQLTWAGRGIGCWHNGRSAHVSTTEKLDDAYIMASGLEWWPEDKRSLMVNGPFTFRTWGDGYGFSLVATGAVDAMLDVAWLWDVAPMPVIIGEAGGTITNLEGIPGIDDVWKVVTNGVLHDQVLEHFNGETTSKEKP